MMFIPRLFYTIVAFLAIILIISGYSKVSSDTSHLEAVVFVDQTMFTKGGLSYFDDITGVKRGYNGVIDWSLFADENSEQAKAQLLDAIYYGEDNDWIAAEIELENLKTKEKKKVEYNPDLWKRELVFAGGAKQFINKRYVQIRNEDGSYSPGVLSYEIKIS